MREAVRATRDGFLNVVLGDTVDMDEHKPAVWVFTQVSGWLPLSSHALMLHFRRGSRCQSTRGVDIDRCVFHPLEGAYSITEIACQSSTMLVNDVVAQSPPWAKAANA